MFVSYRLQVESYLSRLYSTHPTLTDIPPNYPVQGIIIIFLIWFFCKYLRHQYSPGVLYQCKMFVIKLSFSENSLYILWWKTFLKTTCKAHPNSISITILACNIYSLYAVHIVLKKWVDGINYCYFKWIYSFIYSDYFYSTSSSPLLLRCAPDYSIGTVSEITSRCATGNCEWRTCPRSIHGG